ncbi:hypothetical protein LAT59_00715 [Candidatus Gracilibacteria bacterium]|nr:hypothetical protein [Candidatus Gracilibacteria bacterium]
MSEEKYIIFTDLKDFTYKNSLLTSSQIQEILTKFDSFVKEASRKYQVKLLKSIGDAYFVISDSAEAAYGFSTHLLELSKEYDDTQKLDIKKISLRLTLTYGAITKNTSLDLEDYFGEPINLGARIMDITPAGHIFCTEEVMHAFSQFSNYEGIGLFSFHGILTQIPLYSITPITEEEIQALHNTDETRLKECDVIIFRASAVAAVLSVQPIPFIDNFHLLAVHLYMILHIGRKFRNDMHLADAGKIFRELIAPLGLSYVAFQGSSTILKILLPGIGGYLFAPVSFAVSYALGKVYVAYFYYDACGEKMSRELIKELFIKQKEEGKKLAKTQKKTITEIGKKYMKDILSIKKEKDYEKIHKDTVRMLKSK